MAEAHSPNLNDARSAATQRRLIDAAVASLVEVGFARTTGVEVCRRAEMTRGALNHHFSDFSELLVATLDAVYGQLLSDREAKPDRRGLVGVVEHAYRNVTRPEFKAVIELWLAARNDPEFGQRLAAAIAEGSQRFDPNLLFSAIGVDLSEQQRRVYRTIVEALIGIGLGRAVSGQPMVHEQDVVNELRELARRADEQPDQKYGRA